MPASPEVLNVLREHSVLHAPPGKPFILKSGKESMHYVDVRLSALNPRGLRVIAEELYWRAILGGSASHVAGVALGGCPLATGVSSMSLTLSEVTKEDGSPRYDKIPVFGALYVRPEAKDHGTGKLVEGQFKAGDEVVLLEDVVTSGGSSLKAIEVLRGAGLVVKAVVAVLDREESGGMKIAAEVPFIRLCTLSELLAA